VGTPAATTSASDLENGRQAVVSPTLQRSAASGSESRPDFTHDVVDLKRLEESWLFFKLGTPSGQKPLPPGFLWLPIGFICDLLDRRFPIIQVHGQFLI
jgi:hypothetical protein